jgi:hypothetical protein
MDHKPSTPSPPAPVLILPDPDLDHRRHPDRYERLDRQADALLSDYGSAAIHHRGRHDADD